LTSARQHHVVPEFYLAGFTDTGERDAPLIALDLMDGGTFLGSPQKLGRHRDFYRVELPEIPQDFVEKEVLAKLEGEARRVIADIARSNQLPRGDDLELTMHFIAVMALRVPGWRSAYTEPMGRVMADVLRLALETQGRWNRERERMRHATGQELPNVTYEEMREYANGCEPATVEFHSNFHVGLMLEMYPKLAQMLIRRQWLLIVSDGEVGDFLTSDRPVAVE